MTLTVEALRREGFYTSIDFEQRTTSNIRFNGDGAYAVYGLTDICQKKFVFAVIHSLNCGSSSNHQSIFRMKQSENLHEFLLL